MGPRCSKCIPNLQQPSNVDQRVDDFDDIERDGLVDRCDSPKTTPGKGTRERQLSCADDDGFDRGGFAKLSTSEPIQITAETEAQKEAQMLQEAKEAKRKAKELEERHREQERELAREEQERQKEREKQAELDAIAQEQQALADARRRREQEETDRRLKKEQDEKKAAEKAARLNERAAAAAEAAAEAAISPPSKTRAKVNDRMAAARRKAEKAKNRKRAELQLFAAKKNSEITSSESRQQELLEQEKELKAEVAAYDKGSEITASLAKMVGAGPSALFGGMKLPKMLEASDSEESPTPTPKSHSSLPFTPTADAGTLQEELHSRERSESDAILAAREAELHEKQQKRLERRRREERRVSAELEVMASSPPQSTPDKETVISFDNLPEPVVGFDGSEIFGPEPAGEEERVQALAKVFAAFDLDGSGSIEKQELLALASVNHSLSGIYGKWTFEKNERFVTLVDSDGNGQISCDEFCNFLAHELPKDNDSFNQIVAAFVKTAHAHASRSDSFSAQSMHNEQRSSLSDQCLTPESQTEPDVEACLLDGTALRMTLAELLQGHRESVEGLSIDGEAAKAVTEAVLYTAVGELTQLKRVSIRACRSVSERVAKKLGNVQLAECRLEDCGLKNACVIGLVSGSSSSSLTTLSLAHNPLLSDGSMMTIARNCHGLTSLDLRGMDQLSDKAVSKILSGCVDTLTHFYSCTNAGDECLEALGECAGLKLLCLDGSIQVRVPDLVELLNYKAFSLTELSLKGWQIKDMRLREVLSELTSRGVKVYNFT